MAAPPDTLRALTPAQAAIVAHARQHPDSAAYHMGVAVEIHGPLDVDALARALQSLIDRHAALRTSFTSTGAMPQQRIRHTAQFSVTIADSRGDVHNGLDNIVAAEVKRPFDLEHGLPCRALLLRETPTTSTLVLTLHHAVADGASLRLLLDELWQAYDGGGAALPSAGGYEAFLDRLAALGVDDDRQRALAYWRQRLDAAPALIDLPADRPRPAARTFRGDTESFSLGPRAAGALERLCASEGVTPACGLLTIAAALLHRYTSQSDIVIGWPFSARVDAALDRTVALVSRLLPIRSTATHQQSMRQAMRLFRDATLAAYEHSALALEGIVDTLRIDRDPGCPPLVQAVVGYQGAGVSGLRQQVAGLQITTRHVPTRTAKFELTLSFEQLDDDIVGFVEYSTDRFERPAIVRLIGHIRTLLDGALRQPETPLAALPMIGARERQSAIDWGSPIGVDGPADTIATRFDRVAAARHEAVAIVEPETTTSPRTTVTYAALDDRAAAIADRLRARGIRRGDRIALLMRPGIDLIASMLAAARIGVAYVPLDPAWPDDRLHFVAIDSGARAIVAGREHQHRLAQLFEHRSDAPAMPVPVSMPMLILPIDEPISPAIDRPAASAPFDTLPAYVIYTSGSTGRPKGVEVTHRSVLQLLDSARTCLSFDESDVWQLFHSPSFDFSVWEIWGALLTGARLLIVPEPMRRDPEAQVRLAAREGLTVLNATPGAFIGFQKAAVAIDAPRLSLRHVIFGGDRLEPASLMRWIERYGDAAPALINMYGITETTVHVTWTRITAAACQPGAASPIGRPLPGVALYVRDASGDLAPVGVAGEICVGGSGVGLGYVGRPGLTAERFVPDPFSLIPGARMYRSGDLARRTSDDGLEYLGRADSQVKIRGFRIESREVEAALAGHPLVDDAVVMVSGQGVEAQLIAWVAARPGVDARSLRDWIRRSLPDYMLPARLVMLDRLPLTENGKIDRGRLPAPPTDVDDAAAFVPPSTPAEAILADVWKRVLRRDRVSVTDNFFHVGGDSIRAIQVVDLAASHGLGGSIHELFRGPTIREYARLAQAAAAGEPVTVAPFSLIDDADRRELPGDAEDAYPLTALQAGMLYAMQRSPELLPYHNVDSWRLGMRFDPAALRAALEHIVERHPILRTSFHLTGYTQSLQIVHAAAILPFDCVDLRGLDPPAQDAAIAQYVETERAHPFALTEPPLLRVAVHVLDTGLVQFTLTECHAILDGWSLHTLLAELFETYFEVLDGQYATAAATATAAAAGAAAAAPGTRVESDRAAFRDYVALEARASADPESRTFWTGELTGRPDACFPQLYAHTDRRVDAPAFRSRELLLDPALCQALEQVARRAGVPLKSVLLAAHVKALGASCGVTDVLTGMTLNGRPESRDGTRVCGLFLNTLPLRFHLRPGSWIDLARQAYAAETAILPHRRYPMARLQAERGPAPLFRTSFNFTHFHVIGELLRTGRLTHVGQRIGADPTLRVEPTDIELVAGFLCNPGSSGILLCLDHSAEALSAAQADRLGQLYLDVLQRLADDPEARHDAHDFLTTDERRANRHVWNDTDTPLPDATSIVDLIERQAARTPDAIAAIADVSVGVGVSASATNGESSRAVLTYRDLDRAADTLARELRDRGVGPETIVGVLAERSLDMVVALLAVLKDGGAYLPLDPELPDERLSWMIGGAAPAVVLTTPSVRDRALPPGTIVIPVRLSREAAPLSAAHTAARTIHPLNAATVLYTSGSTGRPKAVVNTHLGLINRLRWMQRAYPLEPSDRVLHKTTFSFDVSIQEIFWPLMTGAAIVLARPGGQRDPEYLRDLMIRESVTTTHFVPSMLREFVHTPGVDRIHSLRRVIASGEALTGEHATRFFEVLDASLHNLYGPTESSIDVTAWTCRHDDERAPASYVPIGRPIDNVTIHVLDQDLREVLPGVPGELCIGGIGLARGYAGRPALTAERFCPNPLARVPGERLYRTGDLARQRPDGAIEFLGRADRQIKIRGFRVQPEEIEQVLRDDPAVRECVVTAAHGWLAAHVVTIGPIDDDRLRVRARAALPPYMVPEIYASTDPLPRTSSGKIDITVLEARATGPAPARPTVAARSAIERTIANIWQALLGGREIGVEDSFFDVGGHSLLLIQVRHQLRAQLSVDLPLTTLLRFPTIADLARHIGMIASGASAAPSAPAHVRARPPRPRRLAARVRRAGEP